MQSSLPRRFAAVALAGFMFCQLVVAALAAPPAAFRDGVQAYNTRNYRLALTKFQQAAQVAPTDAASHYYMGLCYQGMNQYTLAQQQFQWVASSGNVPALRSQAALALQNLSRYSRTHEGAAMPTAARSATAARPQSGSPSASPSGRTISGKMTIYDFYTDWCGPCKRFEPIWEETARQLRDVTFKRLNAEDEANASLVQKYKVNSYPTVVYTDGTGAEYDRTHGFASAEDFTNHIRKLQGK